MCKVTSLQSDLGAFLDVPGLNVYDALGGAEGDGFDWMLPFWTTVDGSFPKLASGSAKPITLFLNESSKKKPKYDDFKVWQSRRAGRAVQAGGIGVNIGKSEQPQWPWGKDKESGDREGGGDARECEDVSKPEEFCFANDELVSKRTNGSPDASDVSQPTTEQWKIAAKGISAGDGMDSAPRIGTEAQSDIPVKPFNDDLWGFMLARRSILKLIAESFFLKMENTTRTATTTDPYTKVDSASNSNPSSGSSKQNSQRTNSGKSSQSRSTLNSSTKSGSGGGSGGSGGSGDDGGWGQGPGKPPDGGGPFGPDGHNGWLVLAAAVALLGSAVAQWLKKKGRRRRGDAGCEAGLASRQVPAICRGGSMTAASDLRFPTLGCAEEESVGDGGESRGEHVRDVESGPLHNREDDSLGDGSRPLSIRSRGLPGPVVTPGMRSESPYVATPDLPSDGEPRQLQGGIHPNRSDGSDAVPGCAMSEESEYGGREAEAEAVKKEMEAIMDRLTAAEGDLQRSEQRRKDALKELANMSAKYECEVTDLRSQIKGHEEQHLQIEKHLEDVRDERDELGLTIRDAEMTLMKFQPTLRRTQREVEDLQHKVQYMSNNVQELVYELNMSNKARDRVVNKKAALEAEVEEIKEILDMMVTAEVDLGQAPSEEQIRRLEMCLVALREYNAKSTALRSAQLMGATQHMITAFQHLLERIKDSGLKSRQLGLTLANVQNQLEAAGKEGGDLRNHLNELEAKVVNLKVEKESMQDIIRKQQISLNEKSSLLEGVQEQLKDSQAALRQMTKEQDDLRSQVTEKEAAISELRASMKRALEEGKASKKEIMELVEEKRNLQTEINGLCKRIDQFQQEAVRLQSESNTLRNDLDDERLTRQHFEKETDKLTESHTELRRAADAELVAMRSELDRAQRNAARFEKTCKQLEQAREQLQTVYEKETAKLSNQLERLKQNPGKATPRRKSGTSVSRRTRELRSIMESAKGRGLKLPTPPPAQLHTDRSHASPPSPTPTPEEPPAPSMVDPTMNEAASKVREWMDTSSAVQSTAARLMNFPSFKTVENGPNEMSAVDVISDMLGRSESFPRQRRASWPQDMNATISDHLFGAAQEVVDLTAASLELANQRDGAVGELSEAGRFIVEAQRRLEDQDASMSELTEHFLQVYQIASDLATENDNAMSELADLRRTSDTLKSQLSERDKQLAAMEAERVMATLPVPRSDGYRSDGFSDISVDVGGVFDKPQITPRSTSSVDGIRPRRVPRPQSAGQRSTGQRPNSQAGPPTPGRRSPTSRKGGISSPEVMNTARSARAETPTTPNGPSRIPTAPFQTRSGSVGGSAELTEGLAAGINLIPEDQMNQDIPPSESEGISESGSSCGDKV